MHVVYPDILQEQESITYSEVQLIAVWNNIVHGMAVIFHYFSPVT
jgi:hypothetical protein